MAEPWVGPRNQDRLFDREVRDLYTAGMLGWRRRLSRASRPDRSALSPHRPLDSATEAALNDDGRPGARAILNAISRRRFESRSEGQRLRSMLRYETALWSKGLMHVAGVDEAGMSPLAGPVAAAAVVFAPGSRIPGHKGYPVAEHGNALRKLGACPIHRCSFTRVRTALGLPPLPPWPAKSKMLPAGPGT